MVLPDVEIFAEGVVDDVDIVIEVRSLFVSDVDTLPIADVGCRNLSSCTGVLVGVVSGESLFSEVLATSTLGEIWPLEMLTDAEVV